MPQLSQLSQVYLSQFLWLAIALAFIFFVIARGMVPKIQATVDAREQTYRQGPGSCAGRSGDRGRDRSSVARADGFGARRSRSHRRGRQGGRAPRHGSQGQGGGRAVNAKVEAAQGGIREALTSARAEIEAVAAEATREMVQQAAGLTVDSQDAAAAVKAEFNV